MQRFSSYYAAGLLLLMAVLAWGAALRTSITFDEMAHTGAGLSYLQKRDMRFNEEHPPLSKLIAAIPLALTHTKADYEGPVWTHSASFFSGVIGQWIFGSQVLMRLNDPRRTMLLARLPMMLVTLLLGWCIFRFSQRLGGDWAGLLCLAVYATSPLFLGLGSLVMTDVTLTLFALLATWTFANLWENPTTRNIVLFSLSLAAAILSKFSSGLLFFAIAAFIAISLFSPIAENRGRVAAVLKGVLLTACWVYLFILILSWNQPVDVPGIAPGVIGRLFMPVWIYIRGIILFVVMSSGASYILGHEYYNGVWFYFPVLFLLKSAPGFIGLLIVLGIAKLQKVNKPEHAGSLRIHWRVVWVFAAVFGGLCILSHYNRDFRHFCFPVVLLMMMLAAMPRRLQQMERKTLARVLTVTAAVLLLACSLTAVRTFPYYISYVSAFGMGRPSWTLLSGGNLDANQSLYEVAHFAESQGIKDIPVDTTNPVDVTPWVPQGRMWNCQSASATESGLWVAVSANNMSHGHNCSWLLQYPHQELAGQSMYLIHMPDLIPDPGVNGRPPAIRSIVTRSVGIRGDLHTIYLDLLNHPDKFPELISGVDAAASDEARRKFSRILSILWHGRN